MSNATTQALIRLRDGAMPPITHPATVTVTAAVDGSDDGVPVMVRLDGSTDDLPAENVTGRWLRVGQRVMCLIVPPEGLLVFGIRGTYEPPYFRFADSLSLTQNVLTQVTWSSVAKDTEGAFTAPFSTFSVPIDGLWHIQARLRTAVGVAGPRAFIEIRVDGAPPPGFELRSLWNGEVAGVTHMLGQRLTTQVLDVQLIADTLTTNPDDVDLRVEGTWLGRVA